MNMKMNMERYAHLAPTAVRIGVSLVLLWFGLAQLFDASGWTHWLPAWTTTLPVSGETLVLLNGGFEVLFGALLLLGLFTRVAALLLVLHMFHLVVTVGYNEIGVRDFGLAMAMAGVFLYGPDAYTLDARLARRRSADATTGPPGASL